MPSAVLGAACEPHRALCEAGASTEVAAGNSEEIRVSDEFDYCHLKPSRGLRVQRSSQRALPFGWLVYQFSCRSATPCVVRLFSGVLVATGDMLRTLLALLSNVSMERAKAAAIFDIDVVGAVTSLLAHSFRHPGSFGEPICLCVGVCVRPSKMSPATR